MRLKKPISPHFCSVILGILGKIHFWLTVCECKDAQVNTKSEISAQFYHFRCSKVSLELAGTKRKFWEPKNWIILIFFSTFFSIEPEFSCEPILSEGKQTFWQLYNLVLNYLPEKKVEIVGNSEPFDGVSLAGNRKGDTDFTWKFPK